MVKNTKCDTLPGSQLRPNVNDSGLQPLQEALSRQLASLKATSYFSLPLVKMLSALLRLAFWRWQLSNQAFAPAKVTSCFSEVYRSQIYALLWTLRTNLLFLLRRAQTWSESQAPHTIVSYSTSPVLGLAAAGQNYYYYSIFYMLKLMHWLLARFSTIFSTIRSVNSCYKPERFHIAR